MFQPDPKATYQMPIHFGGGKFDPTFIITQKATGISISYETSRQSLENFLPEGFELIEPRVSVAYNMFTEINWMHGGAYNVVDISVPVRFHGKKDQLEGMYPLVTWENQTAPILGGREQTGIPKIYADIEDLRVQRPHYIGAASSRGNTFLSLSFEETKELTGKELEAARAQHKSYNVFGWRWIPKVGGPGADLDQFIVYPQGLDLDHAFDGKGSLQWIEQTPMQYGHMHFIVNQLAAIPIKKFVSAILYNGGSRLNSVGSRVLK